MTDEVKDKIDEMFERTAGVPYVTVEEGHKEYIRWICKSCGQAYSVESKSEFDIDQTLKDHIILEHSECKETLDDDSPDRWMVNVSEKGSPYVPQERNLADLVREIVRIELEGI